MYTGHKNTLMPDGQTLVDWITPTVKDEARQFGVDMPSPEQMALVISALRMHTIMVHASDYDRSELGKPNELTTFYPVESSIGRYFRDTGRATLDERRLSE